MQRGTLAAHVTAWLAVVIALALQPGPEPASAGEGMRLSQVENALRAEAGGYQTGDIRIALSLATAGDDWIPLDGGTIGAPGSGATTLADKRARDLFEFLWNHVEDTWAPVRGGRGPPAGATSASDLPKLYRAGGRGVSAAADWEAGKTIQLPHAGSAVLPPIVALVRL